MADDFATMRDKKFEQTADFGFKVRLAIAAGQLKQSWLEFNVTHSNHLHTALPVKQRAYALALLAYRESRLRSANWS